MRSRLLLLAATLVGLLATNPCRAAALAHTLDIDLLGHAGLEVSQVCVAASTIPSEPVCRPPVSSSFASCAAAADSTCTCDGMAHDPSLSCGAHFKPTSAPLQCRSIAGVRSGHTLVLEVTEASQVVIEYAAPTSLALTFTASSAPRVAVLGGDFMPSAAPIQPREFGVLPAGKRYLAQLPLETRCKEYSLVSELSPHTRVCVQLPWPDSTVREQQLGTRLRLPVSRDAWPEKKIQVHVTPSCEQSALAAPGHDVLIGSWQSDSPPLDIALSYVSFVVSWRRPQCFPITDCPEVAVSGEPPCQLLGSNVPASSQDSSGNDLNTCRYDCTLGGPARSAVSLVLEHTQSCGSATFEQVWSDVVALASSRELTSYVPANEQMMCLQYDLEDWRGLTWRNQIEELEIHLPTGSTHRVAVPEKPSRDAPDSASHILPAAGLTCGAKLNYEYAGAREYKRGSATLDDGYVVHARRPAELARRAYSFGLGVGVGMQNLRYEDTTLGYRVLEINAMAQLNEPLFRIGHFFPQARISALFSRQAYQVESADRSGIAPRWQALPYLRVFGELLGVLEGGISYVAVGGGVGYGGPTYTVDDRRVFKRLLLSPRLLGGFRLTSTLSIEGSVRLTVREQGGVVRFQSADGDEFVGNPPLRALAVDGPLGLPVVFWGAMLRVDDPI